MITERVYSKSEIESILKTNGNQATRRKLESWQIKFEVRGRGKNISFDIKEIPADLKFKIFCLTELEVDVRTDFEKLRWFYFYYFGDKYFRDTTDTARAEIMKADGHQLTPQTISKYINHLEKINFIGTTDYIYYSCSTGRKPEEIDQTDYAEAWKQYHFDKLNHGKDVAYRMMIDKLGGKPVRIRKRVNNAFVIDRITELTDIIADDMERIYGKKE